MLARLVHFGDDFARGLANAAHRDDDTIRLRIAFIHERSIRTASKTSRFFEVLLGNFDHVIDVGVLCLTSLEVNIIVFGTAAGDRVGVRVEGSLAELFDLIHRK